MLSQIRRITPEPQPQKAGFHFRVRFVDDAGSEVVVRASVLRSYSSFQAAVLEQLGQVFSDRYQAGEARASEKAGIWADTLDFAMVKPKPPSANSR